MNAQIKKSSLLLGTTQIRYYTLLEDGSPVTECKDFFDRMKTVLAYPTELTMLHQFLVSIGNYGYREEYFLPERKAYKVATPQKDWTDKNCLYGLRLYAYVMTPQVIFLFNGDQKTELDPLACPNCAPYFLKANAMADALIKDRELGRINAIEMDLDYEAGYQLIY